MVVERGFKEKAKAKPWRWWSGHHAEVREVQLRTRWTSAEQSVRWKNACARFAERSFSQMRDLFMGAHSQRHEWDAGHCDTAPRDDFQSSSASLDTQDTELYKDNLFEIFDADERFSSSHASNRQCGWNLSCPAVLELTVLCGRNLKAAEDIHGTKDPFVCIMRMHVGSTEKTNSQQTKVLKKTPHPQWNESFNFEIDSASRHERLHLECFDQDMLRANASLGKASFALAPMQPYQQREFWCRLADESGNTRGEVKVRCTLIPTPAGPANTSKCGGLPRSSGSLVLGAPIYRETGAIVNRRSETEVPGLLPKGSSSFIQRRSSGRLLLDDLPQRSSSFIINLKPKS